MDVNDTTWHGPNEAQNVLFKNFKRIWIADLTI